MHNFIVNASLQIVPVVQDAHPYEWVDKAIEVISRSGIKYEVGPFTTILEGKYDEVMHLVTEVNEMLHSEKCKEWIATIQIQIRSEGDITADEKTEKFR